MQIAKGRQRVRGQEMFLISLMGHLEYAYSYSMELGERVFENTEVGSLSLLQGIFPTQGSNRGLLHFRQILYQLSHKGSKEGNCCQTKSAVVF